MGVATLAKVICGVDQVYWAVLWLRLTNLDERCRAALVVVVPVVVAVPSCCCALFLLLLLLLLSLSRCQQRAVVFFWCCRRLSQVVRGDKVSPKQRWAKARERERGSREKRKWRQAALRLWRPRKNKTAHNLISTIPQRRNAAASCGCYRSPGIIITFNGK